MERGEEGIFGISDNMGGETRRAEMPEVWIRGRGDNNTSLSVIFGVAGRHLVSRHVRRLLREGAGVEKETLQVGSLSPDSVAQQGC